MIMIPVDHCLQGDGTTNESIIDEVVIPCSRNHWRYPHDIPIRYSIRFTIEMCIYPQDSRLALPIIPSSSSDLSREFHRIHPQNFTWNPKMVTSKCGKLWKGLRAPSDHGPARLVIVGIPPISTVHITLVRKMFWTIVSPRKRITGWISTSHGTFCDWRILSELVWREPFQDLFQLFQDHMISL